MIVRHRLFLLAALLAVGASLIYGLPGQPVLGDRAYFTYAAQRVHAGDPLYVATTVGYTPYGPLLSAFAMQAADLIGVPTYIAPRLVGPILFVLAALLLYALCRAVTTSEITAFAAAATFTGFGYLAIVSVASLEPKMLVVVSTLVGALALLRRKPFITGISVGLAAMAWQPAIVNGIAFVAYIAVRRRRTLWMIGWLIAGAIAAVVPGLLYIISTGQWDVFLHQAFLWKAIGSAGGGSWIWLASWSGSYNTEWFVFPLAIAGLLFHAVSAVVAVRSGTVRANRGLDLVVLLSIMWMGWSWFDFQGAGDWLPLLPLISFWAAVALGSLLEAVEKRLLSFSLRTRHLMIAVFATFYGFALFEDALRYRPSLTLEDQIDYVAEVLRGDDVFVAFDADEFYVLTETRAPVLPTRLAPWSDRLIEWRDPQGVLGTALELIQLDPEVVVIADSARGRLRSHLEPVLEGKQETSLRVPSNYNQNDRGTDRGRRVLVVYRQHAGPDPDRGAISRDDERAKAVTSE